MIKEGSVLKDYIEERVLEVAEYIISSKATIRKTAKVFGVSKYYPQRYDRKIA